MDTTVIDTLRYATRLRDAGVEGRQAEAMARAINDELAAGVATREDLDRSVETLSGKLDHGVATLRGEIAKVDAKLETQGRYAFLALALIVALGLYNAAVPHFAGGARGADGPQSAHTGAAAAETTPAP